MADFGRCLISISGAVSKIGASGAQAGGYISVDRRRSTDPLTARSSGEPVDLRRGILKVLNERSAAWLPLLGENAAFVRQAGNKGSRQRKCLAP